MRKTLVKQAGYSARNASSCRQARKILFTQVGLDINTLLVSWEQNGVRKFLADAVPYMHAKGGLAVVISEKAHKKEVIESGLADYYITRPFSMDHITFLQDQLSKSPDLGKHKRPSFNVSNEQQPEMFQEEDTLYFSNLFQQPYMEYKKTSLTNRCSPSSPEIMLSERFVHLSSHHSNASTAHHQQLPHVVGTLHMIAPEVISNRTYSFAVDWWSYGVCLYESATGLLPFVGNSITEVYKNATKDRPNLNLVPDSNNLRDFISLLLQVDPNARLGSGPNGVKDVKGHPFFSGVDIESFSQQNEPMDDSAVISEIALAASIATSNNEGSDSLVDFYPHGRMPVIDKVQTDSSSTPNSSSTTGASVSGGSVTQFTGITVHNASICSQETVSQQVGNDCGCAVTTKTPSQFFLCQRSLSLARYLP